VKNNIIALFGGSFLVALYYLVATYLDPSYSEDRNHNEKPTKTAEVQYLRQANIAEATARPDSNTAIFIGPVAVYPWKNQ